jgi:hypothetical protein
VKNIVHQLSRLTVIRGEMVGRALDGIGKSAINPVANAILFGDLFCTPLVF